jgi:hypothetical protein
MRIFSMIFRTCPWFVLGVPLLVTTALGTSACTRSGPHGSSGDAGAGGESACPVHLPEPQFVLEIRAEMGPVPRDTRVVVQWSAADEPAFVLSDPTTWKTLDDSVNLVCNVDRTKPPPEDLSVLVCELWTSGAVNLFVEGTGYSPHEVTLKPVMNELCEEPMSTTLPIVLYPPVPDAGPPP